MNVSESMKTWRSLQKWLRRKSGIKNDKARNDWMTKLNKLKIWVTAKLGDTVETDQLHMMPRWHSLKE